MDDKVGCIKFSIFINLILFYFVQWGGYINVYIPENCGQK